VGPLAPITKVDGNCCLSNFEPESKIEVSFARFGLEPLVENKSSQCLVRKDRTAHRALPGKVALSAKRRKVGTGEVEHESGAALLAAHLKTAEFRIRDRDLLLAHRPIILGEQPAESNRGSDGSDAADEPERQRASSLGAAGYKPSARTS